MKIIYANGQEIINPQPLLMLNGSSNVRLLVEHHVVSPKCLKQSRFGELPVLAVGVISDVHQVDACLEVFTLN